MDSALDKAEPRYGMATHEKSKTMKHLLTIHEDGTLTSLGNPLGLPDVVSRKRFSHIKPVNPPLRVAFDTVRYLFGDDGRAAAWTRRWRVNWRCTILSSGEALESSSRTLLIDWEHEKHFMKEGADL